MMKYNHTVDYCVTLKKGSSYALLYKKSSRYISVQLIKINGKKKRYISTWKEQGTGEWVYCATFCIKGEKLIYEDKLCIDYLDAYKQI